MRRSKVVFLALTMVTVLTSGGALAAPSDSLTPTRRCPEGMALLPGGQLELGTRGDVVAVRPFCMDRTEVTLDAYEACARAGKCPRARAGLLCNAGQVGRGSHPVNCVDWAQATAFCASAGKRLPSEEEWEWAARGGPAATVFPWGNEAPGSRLCWDGEGGGGPVGSRWARNSGTCPVGAYPGGDSPQGIHDLAGNVGEWTTSPREAGDPTRVIRGGAWLSGSPVFVTAAFRTFLLPSDSNWAVGFRCVQ